MTDKKPSLSGFTIARNVVRYEYPFQQSLATLLELCDEVVVALSPSEDGTEKIVEEASRTSPHLRVVHFFWDDSLREGGKVLALATRSALEFCQGRWCIYLQADELIHEQDFPRVRQAIEMMDPDPRIEAIVLPYLHFYGSYEYVATGRRWYRFEARIFRNTGWVEPYRDAQGFRVREGERLRKIRGVIAPIPVYHYGWVRSPQAQMAKLRAFYRLYHSDEEIVRIFGERRLFDYRSAYEVRRFSGSHPRRMTPWIERSKSWSDRFDPSLLPSKPLWMRISDWFEERTKIRIGEFRNFTLVPPRRVEIP